MCKIEDSSLKQSIARKKSKNKHFQKDFSFQFANLKREKSIYNSLKMVAESEYLKLVFKALNIVTTDHKLQNELHLISSVEMRLKKLDESLCQKGLNMSQHVQKWRRNNQRTTNCDASKKWRSKGNEFYKAKKLDQALMCYTKALNNLPLDNPETSLEMALCLGNRSAALFELKDYDGALGNAYLAMSCDGFNEDKRERLQDRCNKCQQIIKKESNQRKILANIDSIRNTFNERDSKVELAVAQGDPLKIEFDSVKGRHGVAGRDIHFGEIVLVDKPIGMVPLTLKPVLNGDQNSGYINSPIERNLTCNHCLKTQSGRFESPFIGSEALFCSTTCLVLAFKSYHCFESKFDFYKMLVGGQPSPRDINLDSPARRMHLACRLVNRKPAAYFTELFMHKDKTEEELLAEKKYGSNLRIPDIDPDQCLQSLLTHDLCRPKTEQIGYSINALTLLHCLGAMEYIPSQMNESSYFIGMCIYNYLAVLTMNGHAVLSRSPDEELIKKSMAAGMLTLPLEVVGSALFPTLALINHSCKPNTVRFNQGCKVVVIAAQDIPKGTEISDSYGLVHYLTNEKEERQAILKKRFNFQCNCIACVEDFPIYNRLPHDLPENAMTKEFSDLLETLNNQLGEQNYTAALISCSKVYHTLQKLGVTAPHTAYAKLTFQLHTVSLGLYAA